MQGSISRALLACVLAVLAACWSAGNAAARIVVIEKVAYYPVSGLNGLDLGRAMLKGGARTINLRDAIAATTTTFDFSKPVVAVEHGRCVVKSINVHLRILYQFPKWNGRGRASRSLRRNWDAFYAELVRHEHEHGRIAKKYAKRVEQEMLRLSGTVAFGCRDFGRFSEMRFNALVAQLKQAQLAFDRREDLPTSRITRLQVRLLKTD